MGTNNKISLVIKGNKPQFYRDGYLHVPSFLSSEDVEAMLDRSKILLDEFDVESHPMVIENNGYIRNIHQMTDADSFHDRR